MEQAATPFGRAVRARRLELGLTQEDVASAVGIERSYLSRVERGDAPPFTSERLAPLGGILRLDEPALAALARGSRLAYRLTGIEVTELHRDVALALESSWDDLPRETLDRIARIVERSESVLLRPEPTAFGRLLLEHRLARGWSQARMAESIGVARSYVSMVESGAEPAFADPIVRDLARLMRIPVADLRAVAESAKAAYRLGGVDVSDAHHVAGAQLERRWTSLPSDALRRVAKAIGADV